MVAPIGCVMGDHWANFDGMVFSRHPRKDGAAEGRGAYMLLFRNGAM